MDKQPTALRLADDLETQVGGKIAYRAAAELRLLHLQSKPWVGLENIDFQYQPPAEVITMKYAEAILKEKNK